MANRKPRFFCDNCGHEVDSDVVHCPFCARMFTSVRCPNCGYSGPDKMFQGGCPMCGYSAPPPPKTKPRVIYAPKEKERFRGEPLPIWTYILGFLALIALVALLAHFLTR